MTTQPIAQIPPAYIDPSKASGVPCLVVDEHEVLATLSLSHLNQLVPNPTQFEDKRLQPSLFSNPAYADLAHTRESVQRFFTGAKKANLANYAEFIFERVSKRRHRGTPTICLGTSSKLTVVPQQDGTARVAIPYGRLFLAVDGETQRAAWEDVYARVWALIQSEVLPEELLDDIRIPVEIHHGLSTEALSSLFYERNVLGAKVNPNEAIAKDQRDPATQIARVVMAMPVRMSNGQMVPTSSIVQQQSRQVGKKSPHWVTLSALRTLIVTTVLGRSGLQYGAKPVPMPDDVDFDNLKNEVAGVVHAILQHFVGQFTDKERYLIGAPAIMAGIGVTANRVITSLPSRPADLITIEQLLARLDEVRWEKEEGFWEGIGTRKTPKGVTTVAGPKEVGYAVADAIEGANVATAAQVRGRPAPAADPEPSPWQQVPLNV